MRVLIAVLLVVMASSAIAKDEVYKWVDDKGVVHYTDKPPAKNATPAKLPPLQTYKEGTTPNLNKYAKPVAPGATGAAAAGGAVNVEIVTPSREETFRGGERVVPIAVVVTPQIGAGQRLIYLLDGSPASQPTTDTSFALTGVERGQHTVSVTLVGEAGDEIASSNGVTFYMQPPTVDKAAPAKPKPGTNPPKPKP
jgi:Domain of unknown function (DUF4124)